MPKSNVNFRLDDDIKAEAEAVFEDIGISMSAALNLFIKQVINKHAIPFIPEGSKPNSETIRAIEEAERLLKDPNSKRYHSMDELIKELDS